MRLEGLTKSGEIWEQNYEYIKFRPYLVESKDIFEVSKSHIFLLIWCFFPFAQTPVGIFCPGRKPTKKLPKIPTHFSYRIEGTSEELKLSVNQAVSDQFWLFQKFKHSNI